jgi:glucuronate isomerase
MPANFFLHDDFLLYNNYAKELYHSYVKHLPIIDYHTHLLPQAIATNKRFEDITEIWLKGDHYKWRAMRAHGIKEDYITGNTSSIEKFRSWAKVVPFTLRNPLFHWTHMELANPFGIKKYLDELSADEIYHNANDLLQTNDFYVQGLLKHFNVEVVGTTDEPCDSLQYHQQFNQQNIGIKITPAFRPDALLRIEDKASFINNLQLLETTTNRSIKTLDDFIAALQNRVDYFHSNGCRLSDHGLNYIPLSTDRNIGLDESFSTYINNTGASFVAVDQFKGYVLSELCKMYHAKGWVQQLHIGAIRNNNTRLLHNVGADVGCDSIGSHLHAHGLSHLLNKLDGTDQLAKTVLYNLNPADNELFATMAGNFNDGSVKGKIQYGAAWWFLDQKDGMEKQLNTLSNMGLISTFIGMTTDSRSFLSYSRHEYFRRLLCNMFGEDIQKGELPADINWVGGMLQNICYYNAKSYFSF